MYILLHLSIPVPVPRWLVKAVHASVSVRQSVRPGRHVEHGINLAYMCGFPVLP